MSKGIKVVLGVMALLAVIMAGGLWWAAQRVGLGSDMYARAAKLGAPLEPEDLVQTPPPAPEDNAADLLFEFTDAYTKSGIKAGSIFGNSYGTKAEQALARSELKKLATELKLLEQAAEKPECRFERNWARGVYLQFPEMSGIKAGAQLLGARAVLAGADGRFDEALADIERAYKLARFAGEEPHIISLLVRIANEGIALRAVQGAADRMENPTELSRLRELAVANHSEASLYFYVRGELTIAAATARNIHDLEDLKALPEAISGKPVITTPTSLIRSGPTTNSLVRSQFNIFLRNWMPIFEMGEDALDNGKLSSVLKNLDEKATDAPTSAIIFAVLTPPFANTLTAEARRIAIHRATLAYIDILDHRFRTGKLPEKLSDLGGEYVDPFSGEPLKYRVEDGGFRVWSVGANGVDEDGKSGRELGGESTDGDYCLVHPLSAE